MDVSAGDVLLVAVFSEPQFSLLSGDRFAAVCGALHRELTPFGIRASDMEFASSSNLAGSSLKISLLNSALTARLTASQLEVQFLGPRAGDRDRLLGVAGACERAIGEMVPQPHWSSVSLDLEMHGRVSGTTPSAIIGRFISQGPRSLGGLVGSGISFFFAAPEPDIGTAILLLEPSSLVAEGLLFRLQMSWGAVPSLAGIRESAHKYLRRCADEVLVALRGVWR